MTRYLFQRRAGSYFYKRRVPRDLRHRFPGRYVEKYIGRMTAAEARAKVAVINGDLENDFATMRRGDEITEAKVERIRLKAQLDAHRSMKSSPLSGPNRLADDLDALLPNVETDAREALLAAGVDPSDRNLSRAVDAIYLGTMGAQALYEKGVEPPPVESAPIGGTTVLEAATAYQDAPDVATTEKTRRQLLSSARLFSDHVGRDKPVAAIVGRDAVTFLDRLARISPEYRRDRRAGAMTLAEIEADYSTAGDGLSAATLNRHAMHLRVLINWLIARHELPEEHRNPFDRKSRRVKSDGYEPATDGEIAALLAGAHLPTEQAKTFKEAVGWLVMLAIYTGAREGELCALTVDDVMEKDGTRYLAVQDGKTEAARRVVPIHGDLIAAGFLRYVETCKGALFGVTEGTVAKRFPGYRRGRGVDRPRVTFHSLRKSFTAKLEDAGVPSDTVAQLIGHKSGRSFTFSVYSPHGPSLRTLASAVAKVDFGE